MKCLSAAVVALALGCVGLQAQEGTGRVTHRIGVDFRGAWVAPTHDFFRGCNAVGERLDKSGSLHLKYSFEFPSGSRLGSMYPTAYQGVGVALNTFFDPREIGTPAALYVFQGAQIASLGRTLSLDYEWNFGASFGWHPYDQNTNSFNKVVGSKVNAYINLGLILSWRSVQNMTVSGGVELTHFSNGNTTLPNGGVNTLGARIGAVYAISGTDSGRQEATVREVPESRFFVDAVLYGAARAKGLVYEEVPYLLDGKFAVAGVSITPLYRVNKYFRTGVSLDIQYDESTNLASHVAGSVSGDSGQTLRFFRPPFSEQIAAGLSVRAELAMPIFTIGIGVGHNVLYKGDDWGGFYQLATLKADVSRHAFIHIGYRLNRFQDPSNLMLGIGWRFGRL